LGEGADLWREKRSPPVQVRGKKERKSLVGLIFNDKRRLVFHGKVARQGGTRAENSGGAGGGVKSFRRRKE